jgi:hypothetical protein
VQYALTAHTAIKHRDLASFFSEDEAARDNGSGTHPGPERAEQPFGSGVCNLEQAGAILQAAKHGFAWVG